MGHPIPVTEVLDSWPQTVPATRGLIDLAMTEEPGLRVRQGKQGAGIRTANRVREVAVPSPPVTHGGTTDSSEPCDPGKAERDRFVLLLHGLSSQGWCGWMVRETTHSMCDTAGEQSLRVDSVNLLSARTNEVEQQL